MVLFEINFMNLSFHLQLELLFTYVNNWDKSLKSFYIICQIWLQVETLKYQWRKTKLLDFVLKKEQLATRGKNLVFHFRRVSGRWELRNYFQDLTSLSKIPVTHLPCHGFNAVVFDSHCFFWNIRLIKASHVYLLKHSSLFITRHSCLLNLYGSNPMSATSILICPPLMGCSNWTAMEYCCSFEGLLMTWCHVYHSFSEVNGKLHGAEGFAHGSFPLQILMNYNINITQPCMFLQGNAIASFNLDFPGQKANLL